MRIAFIAPQPFIDIRATPMENLRLAQTLADAGHEVHVITYPFGSAPEHRGVTVYRCRPIPFVRSVGIGFSIAKVLLDVSLALLAFRLWRKIGFDCVHGVEEGVFIGAVLARFARVPLVYDMDSVMSYDISASRIGSLPLATKLARVLERRAVRSAAVVITISKGMAACVEEIDPSKRVAIVPDIPLPLPPGGPNPGRAREQLPCEFARRRLIVYAGSLARYQGLDLLVSAMPEVAADAADSALVIIGGDEPEIRRLAEMAKAAGVVHNVLFMGKKPPEQIPDFLASASVLVSPRRTGMNPPAKIYTYMQSGVPIVATNIPAHTAVLDSNAATLVEPVPDGIADGVLWALAHPSEALALASRAQEVVRGITPELRKQRILEAYRVVKESLPDRPSGRRYSPNLE